MNNKGNGKFNYLEFIAQRVVKPLHRSAISGRRVNVLGNHLIQLLPENILLKGLDVGCGSGELSKYVQDRCPETKIYGVDILAREDAVIEVKNFDGIRLPFADQSYDFVMLIDVLHHTDYPQKLMQECVRVTRKFILIKDHNCESWLDRVCLRFMDWVGNRSYNVYLPYNYLSKSDWKKLYQASGIVCEANLSELHLYPKPFSFLFDRNLHFIARLAISAVNQV